jgi:hypothetical protein
MSRATGAADRHQHDQSRSAADPDQTPASEKRRELHAPQPRSWMSSAGTSHSKMSRDRRSAKERRTMLRLHDNATSGNAYKIRLLLAQLGLPFERVEYDIDHGATRTSEFLAKKNANGRIPVLELEDGRLLPESNAILWYLAEGTRYLPGGADEDARWRRAQVLQWMFFEQYSHEPNIATVRYWITHKLEMTAERVASLPGRRKAGAPPCR